MTPAAVGAALEALRDQQPLVQCLTGIVAAPWTANVLLAAGAVPAMVDNPREAGAFAGVASGVLVNLGTPYNETVTAMRAAVEAAAASGTPWVLDPVSAGALAWRTGIARDLLALASPAVIRGNASEILALGGGTGGKGRDITGTPGAVVGAGAGAGAGAVAGAVAVAAAALAAEHRCAVAVSGPVDHIADGARAVRIGNGHPWLTRVSGAGCALGAMIAAFAAVSPDPLVAAVAATATLTVAADEAAARASGPGSFAVALLDQLAAVTPERLAAQVRLT